LIRETGTTANAVVEIGMKQRTKKRCLLCGANLKATSVPNLWDHPESAKCAVRIADDYGVSADDKFYFAEDGSIWEYDDGTKPLAAEFYMEDGTEIVPISSPFVACDVALEIIFDNAGLPRLGGASGDRGWSSMSTFQKCPYLWKRRYLVPRPVGSGPGPKSLELGSILHTYLALYYSQIIDSTYPLSPEECHQRLLDAMVTPEIVEEAWRIYQAYIIYYHHDDFVPLAVEYHLVDPSTGRSCRYDLIARKDKPSPGLLPGTYIFDHKTRGRFDASIMTEWRNDGELIGQWELYEKLKLEKRFGPLQGLCANLIGKQKDPKFERAWIRPSDSLLRDHKRSLAIWSAKLDLAKAQGDFPRARANCVTRFGLCDQFEHCAQEAE
jgi:hypothetical protein